jgi:hypothetical protein
VTAVELLSPANKVTGSRGRAAMMDKRDTLRRGGVHWVEVDLLRGGLREPRLAGRSDYCASVVRAGDAHLYAWFVDLRDRLPVIGVPVRAPDPDLPLDLQHALDQAFDRAGYARLADYYRPLPDPPLAPPDRAWVEGVLAGWREENASQT